MKSPKKLSRPSSTAWKSRRRIVDTAGIVIFHLATIGVVAASDRKLVSSGLLIVLPVLALDCVYFFAPPKRKPILDDLPDQAAPVKTLPTEIFALDYSLLLVPPLILIAWFLSIIWQHRPLAQPELIAVLIAIPAGVGLVSWITYLRMTRRFAGVKNEATKFIVFSLLATWIGSTFLFVLLAASFFLKLH